MEDSTPISVALTNLGKYNEGCLAFKWLGLPATTEQVQQAFREIGIDGIRYEEWFLSDYESTLIGVGGQIGEYSNLDELNYLATLITEMEPHEKRVFEAVAEWGDHTDSIKDLINVAHNLDSFYLDTEIHSTNDLGYSRQEEQGEQIRTLLGSFPLYMKDEAAAITSYIETLESNFNVERYGEGIESCEFGAYTEHGYITGGECITEHYDGWEVPEEYKITSYPKPRGIEQMERAAAGGADKNTPEPER